MVDTFEESLLHYNYPFPIYSKSAADEFEIIFPKKYGNLLSINESIITEKNENIVTKGEIAHYERFLLLPQCFQELSAAVVLESIYMRQWVKR